MKKQTLSIPLLALAFVVAGCSNPVGVEEDGIRVQATDAQVEIQNSRSNTVFFGMLERQFSATALFGPCTDPDTCPQVAPGQTLRVDQDQIGGIEGDSEEAIFFWWELVPDGDGGFEPDEVRSIVFPLK